MLKKQREAGVGWKEKKKEIQKINSHRLAVIEFNEQPAGALLIFHQQFSVIIIIIIVVCEF